MTVSAMSEVLSHRIATYIALAKEKRWLVKEWVAHSALDQVTQVQLRVCASLGAFSFVGSGLREEGHPPLLGKPWTILKTTQWLSDAIHVKQDDVAR